MTTLRNLDLGSDFPLVCGRRQRILFRRILVLNPTFYKWKRLQKRLDQLGLPEFTQTKLNNKLN